MWLRREERFIPSETDQRRQKIQQQTLTELAFHTDEDFSNGITVSSSVLSRTSASASSSSTNPCVMRGCWLPLVGIKLVGTTATCPTKYEESAHSEGLLGISDEATSGSASSDGSKKTAIVNAPSRAFRSTLMRTDLQFGDTQESAPISHSPLKARITYHSYTSPGAISSVAQARVSCNEANIALSSRIQTKESLSMNLRRTFRGCWLSSPNLRASGIDLSMRIDQLLRARVGPSDTTAALHQHDVARASVS